MATKATGTKSTYSITGTLNLQIAIETQAASLDDAVNQAKELKEADFVDMQGDYIDGSMEITGIFKV